MGISLVSYPWGFLRVELLVLALVGVGYNRCKKTGSARRYTRPIVSLAGNRHEPRALAGKIHVDEGEYAFVVSI